jgi:type III restriction enzyme
LAKAKLSVDRFSVEDLVLPVSGTHDPAIFDLDAYDEFINEVVAGRAYSHEAIRKALIFMIAGQYASTRELAEQAFSSVPAIERRYGTVEKLVARLAFPEKLSCALDLATGTGKSFVMFCLARIMLNESIVNRVLILCPSRTIEAGLIDKFDSMLADSDLTALLPQGPGTRLPERVDATSTVKEGEICIENIHQAYQTAGSSIRDSFRGQGGTALVLSDEAHHLYSPVGAAMKKWKEFVADPEFGFRYHVGLSGTCYIGNDYFPDVVHRYSIRDAIADSWVKEVFYVTKDDSSTQDERFQKLLSQHEQNRKSFAGKKPLTIAVTSNIKAAEALEAELIDFLAKDLRGGRKQAETRVLTVTSAPKHEKNLLALETVDEETNPVEWIVSVAMLSEGWDVKNVFQIYPHEKRAFNSKLLIAQVLGRGLRRPEGLKAAPRVFVFNHDKWGGEVEDLVAEVLDQETTIAQRPTDKRPIKHFDLHLLDFTEIPTGIEAKEVEKPKDIQKLNLRPQGDAEESVEWASVTDSAKRLTTVTLVRNTYYSLSAVVAEVRQRMKTHDELTGGDLMKQYPKARIERLIRDALKRLSISGTKISQENRQLILSAFGSLRQKTTRAGAIVNFEPSGIITKSTSEMGPIRTPIASVTSTTMIAYDELSAELGTPDDKAALKKILEIDVPTYTRRIENSFDLKSPVNLVVASYKPERDFVERLLRSVNRNAIRAWVKAPDVGFYPIEYGYQPGGNGRSKRGEFNPDFFLLLDKNHEAVVVETKMDDDATDQNIGKLAAAKAHFHKLNELLAEEGSTRRYSFHFLSPVDYDKFFAALRNGELSNFTSTLQAQLTPSTS